MRLFYFPRNENPIRFSFFTNLYVAILMCGGIFLVPSLSWAATLYAKQDGIKVTAEKSPTSTVVTKVNAWRVRHSS